MTGEDWGDLESLPKPKSAFPPWLWVCGSGCLLAVLLVVGLLAMGARFVNRGRNPDLQWPQLEQVLEYDERSDEFELKFGWQAFGTEGYTFFEKDGHLFAQLLLVNDDDDEVSVEIESGRREHEEITLTIQGRELHAVRLEGSSETHGPWWGPQNEGGDSLLVLLSEEDATEKLMLIMARHGSGDPVTEEDVARFLAPFHVGPDRAVYEVPDAPEVVETQEDDSESEDGPR